MYLAAKPADEYDVDGEDDDQINNSKIKNETNSNEKRKKLYIKD